MAVGEEGGPDVSYPLLSLELHPRLAALAFGLKGLLPCRTLPTLLPCFLERCYVLSVRKDVNPHVDVVWAWHLCWSLLQHSRLQVVAWSLGVSDPSYNKDLRLLGPRLLVTAVDWAYVRSQPQAVSRASPLVCAPVESYRPRLYSLGCLAHRMCLLGTVGGPVVSSKRSCLESWGLAQGPRRCLLLGWSFYRRTLRTQKHERSDRTRML